MVDEAKKIAEPGSEPVHKMRRKSMFVRKDGAKKTKGTNFCICSFLCVI